MRAKHLHKSKVYQRPRIATDPTSAKPQKILLQPLKAERPITAMGYNRFTLYLLKIFNTSYLRLSFASKRHIKSIDLCGSVNCKIVLKGSYVFKVSIFVGKFVACLLNFKLQHFQLLKLLIVIRC